jgi:hypothetical protein
MDRVSRLVKSELGKDPRLCHIYIDNLVLVEESDFAQAPEVQRNVRNIRTDLDAFSEDEMVALIAKGFSAASASLLKSGIITKEMQPKWSLGFHRDEVSAPKLDDSGRRRFKLFSKRDPVAWLLCVLLVGIIVGSGDLVLFGMLHFRQDLTSNIAGQVRYSDGTVGRALFVQMHTQGIFGHVADSYATTDNYGFFYIRTFGRGSAVLGIYDPRDGSLFQFIPIPLSKNSDMKYAPPPGVGVEKMDYGLYVITLYKKPK